MKFSSVSNVLRKYLVWPGISLFLVGLSAGLVSGAWGTVPLVLMILGLVLVALWVLLQVTAKNFWLKRSTQAGTNALIATLAMLIILGLLNVLVARYPQRFDLTENQIFSLAPQSAEVLKGLTAPVKAYVFAPEKPPQVENLLKNYARLNPEKFSYTFVDPVKEPGLVQAFELKDAGDVFLDVGDSAGGDSAGGATRKIFVQNLSQEPFSESKMTNALARLKGDRTDKVFLLQGHGEHGPEQLSQAIKLLSDRNYTVEPLNLAEQLNSGKGLPKDASVILVSGPQRSFFAEEVKALEQYLNEGGGLLLLIDPNTDPKLGELLSPWGVTLDDRLVIDGSGAIPGSTGGVAGLGPTSPLISRYGDHPITASFGQGNSYYPLSRAIGLQEKSGITAVPLLITNGESWAEKDLKAQVQFDANRDLKGPLTLGAALSKSGPTPNDESRLVVVGNASFATNGPVTQQLNPDVFANSVTWLSQREGEVLSIGPREMTNRRLVLSPLKGNSVALFATLLLPLIGFGSAGFLWWQRR